MKATLLGGAAASLLTISAFAADLRVPPAQPQVVIPPFTWTSCYAGAQAGGGWGKKDLTDSVGIFSSETGYSSTSVDVTGYMVGGQIGCDYQFAPTWVVGIEGAATGGNISKTTNFFVPFVPASAGPDTASFRSTTDFLASITGRIGYAWDRWLVYGKGGVALVGDRYHADDLDGIYFFDATENRIGWTAGAGVEWAFTPEWSVKLEYDYYGFGTKSLSFTDTTILGLPVGSGPPPPFTAPANISQNIQVVTLGVNFHARSGPDW
jgi:outer membrane immunogenic protein